MRRYALAILFACVLVNAHAIKCSDVKAKDRPLTLSEKYCDSSSEKSEEKVPSRFESEAKVRQLRQERFLGANPHSQQQLKAPVTTSEPGFKMPEPFVPPTQDKSGKWDYLK